MTDPNSPTASPDSSGPNTAAPNTGGPDTAGPDTAPTTPLKTTPLKTPPLKTPAADPASTAPDRLPRRRPLFATIFWGALMLAFAAFIAARELVPGGFDLVTWLLTAVVGIGLLLVIAGIIAASRRAG